MLDRSAESKIYPENPKVVQRKEINQRNIPH